MRLSIVIPALDEESALPLLLGDLQPLRARGAEIIVADGGSRDGTVAAAATLADIVLQAPRGRALQLNAGAARARGELLLFLHADSRVPPACVAAIAALADAPSHWGFFRVRLRGASRWLGVVARCMSWRSRLSGIATGDQGLFVPRALFTAVGGYPAQPLMEDIEICRRLRCRGAPLAHRAILESSGRRWDRDGALGTILLMWRLRLRYFLGADPAALHAAYYGQR
jgi:rSAM/selenodomain-associated transferase 2